MIGKCADEGTLQAFLDGELAADATESVARHFAVCGVCANALAEAEDESLQAYSALEIELDTLVPTRRLWTKINDSIESEKVSWWRSVYALLKNPAIAAFAGMLIAFGLYIAYLNVYNDYQNVAGAPEYKINKSKGIAVINDAELRAAIEPDVSPVANNAPKEEKSTTKPVESRYKIVRANLVANDNQKNVVRDDDRDSAKYETPKAQPADYKYLSGEETYIKTIVTLENTIDGRKDEILRPSERFAYENDLAVVNDAIKKTKTEVFKNPKNEAAKEVLRASYQNKIDLLNSVSEKNELMASLK